MKNHTPGLWPRLRMLLALAFIFSVVQPVGASQSSSSPDLAQERTRREANFVPDRLIVKLDPAVSEAFAAQDGQAPSSQAFSNLIPGAQVLAARPLFTLARVSSEANLDGIYRLDLAPGSDVLQAAEALSTNAAIEWAEPDYLAYPTAIPNDPQYGSQWGLTQIGAPAAWNLTTGSSSVSIALLDSGLDFSHPDLASKIWTNPGEIAANGLDDDNNGYIDDLHGWDFVNSDNTPADDNGHGTQTAGVAGAATDNGIGIAGVCWDCSLLPVKVMQAGGVANYSDIAAGVLYAARKGARVINISLGGYSESSALLAAIQAASQTYGSLIVAGAGNDSLETPFYPAAYPQVLAVAATTPGDLRWSGSNFGAWVDVAAPGEAITTTFLGGDYGSVDGTSLSTAFVSGLAGLLRSQYPDWTAEMVRAQIIHTAENIDSLNPGYESKLGAGRIDAASALDTTPHPLLSFAGQTVNGNPNGRPEPGSSVALVVSLYNDWAAATNVQAVLSSTSPYVTITTASAAYGEVPAYATVANPAPFGFTVSASAPYGAELSLNLRLTASGGYVVDIPLTVQTASATVDVPATINTQTWTNDRIYRIVRNSGIPADQTLTIEPGTEIIFTGDYSLTVLGTLIADGSPDSLIKLSASTPQTGQLLFADSSQDAIFGAADEYLSGSIIRYVQISSLRELAMDSAGPYIAHNSLDQVVSGVRSSGSPLIRVENNELLNTPFEAGGYGPVIFKGNRLDGSGINVYYGTSEIRSNRIINCPVGITATADDIVVDGNLIANNARGVYVGNNNIDITRNTFLANTEVGVFLQNSGPLILIQNNNLLVGDTGYAVSNQTTGAITAANNWWGTTHPDTIEDAIYDDTDEFGKGAVVFTPFLTAPEPNVPAYVTDVEISPDTTLGIQTATFDFKFNREMDQSYTPQVGFQSHLDETWATFTEENSGISNHYIADIAVAPDGSIWFAVDTAGAVQYDGQNWTVYNSDNSDILDNSVRSIAITTDGAVWFGHTTGLTYFDGENWIQYNQTDDGMLLRDVDNIVIAPNGSVWFSNYGFGIINFNGTDWFVFNQSNSSIPSNHITTLGITPEGKIWVDFADLCSVALFDGINWTQYFLSGNVCIYAVDIAIANENSVWFADAYIGAIHFDGTRLESINADNSTMPYNGINSIAIDPDSNVWIGGNESVAKFDGEKWVIYYHNLGSWGPTAIAIANDKSIWFAAEGAAHVFWDIPSFDFNSGAWLNAHTYRATLDITSLIPRDDYLINISGALGTDGIEIAPVTGYPFTVDYAGAISDTTPPPAPTVELCAGSTPGSLNASWSVHDPQSAIDRYSYAIGTTPGGSEVVDWTTTMTPSFSRSNLNLTAGQTYYFSVKARNAGGLWSAAGIPPGVAAGSGVCTTNIRSVYLPAVKSRP